MGRQLNQIIEGLSAVTGATSTINVNLDAIEALLTTLQADVAAGIIVSSGTANTNLRDGAGNAITSTTSGTTRRLDVMLSSGGTTGSAAPTNANLVGGTDGTNLRGLSVDSSGRLNTNINGTVPVSQADNFTPSGFSNFTHTGNGTQTSAFSISGYGSIVIALTSVGSGVGYVCQQSVDGTTWYSVGACSYSSTVTPQSNGQMGSTGLFAIPVIGTQARFSLSAGSPVSGTVVLIRDKLSFPTAPAVAGGSVSVSGTVTPIASTGFGYNTFHTAISAASTNATNVKSNASNIGSMIIANVSSSIRYFKLFNLSVAPTIGTSSPVLNYAIQPNTTLNIDCGLSGIRLSTGLSYAITAGQALLDNTAVGAGDVVVNIAYA